MVMKHKGSLQITKTLQVDGGITASGLPIDTHLRYSRAENDAIIGGTDINVVSGTNIITINSTAAGGGSETADIDSINTVTGTLTLNGADGITIVDDTTDNDNPVLTVSGFRTEFVNASGSLQTQIDTADLDVSAITVSGGSDITGVIDFVGEGTGNVSAAGNTITFSAGAGGGGGGGLNNVVEDLTPQLGGNLDAQNFNITDVGDLTAVTGTFTNTTDEIRLIVDGITNSGLLIKEGGSDKWQLVSSVNNLLFFNSNVGLNALVINSVTSNVGIGTPTTTPAERLEVVGSGLFTGDVIANENITASGNITAITGTITAASGSITNLGGTELTFGSGEFATGLTVSGIPVDTTGGGGGGAVDSVNALTGAVIVIGKGEVGVTVEGQNVVVSGTDHTAGGGGGTVSDAIIGGIGITVTSGTSETTIDGHLRYTRAENDAILGIDGITITSGTNVITVSGIPITKSITLESPTPAEDVTVFFAPTAITIRGIRAVIRSGTSVTVDPRHSTDRTASGNQILGAAEVVSGTTTGQKLSITGDTTIPADSWIWLETTAIVGSVEELSLTFIATED